MLIFTLTTTYCTAEEQEVNLHGHSNQYNCASFGSFLTSRFVLEHFLAQKYGVTHLALWNATFNLFFCGIQNNQLRQMEAIDIMDDISNHRSTIYAPYLQSFDHNGLCHRYQIPRRKRVPTDRMRIETSDGARMVRLVACRTQRMEARLLFQSQNGLLV